MSTQAATVAVHSVLEGHLPLDPLFPAPEGPWPLPEALGDALFTQGGRPSECFVVLDAGQIPNLAEMLSASGLDHKCLFTGHVAEELEEYGPWLVKLEQGMQFTRDLFTASAANWHLWGSQRCILIQSVQGFHAVWKHLRKLTQVEGADGRRFYFRFWETAYFRAALLHGEPEDIGRLAPAPLVSQVLLPKDDMLESIAVTPQPPAQGSFVMSAPLRGVFADVALNVFYTRLETRLCASDLMTRQTFTDTLNSALRAGFRDRDVLEALMDWCAVQPEPIFAQPWAKATLQRHAGVQDVSRFGQLRRAAKRAADGKP